MILMRLVTDIRAKGRENVRENTHDLRALDFQGKLHEFRFASELSAERASHERAPPQ